MVRQVSCTVLCFLVAGLVYGQILPPPPISSSTTQHSSGLNNVLDYAGTVAINDGGSHTISSAPIGSPFRGVTTLAALAAITISGSQPFFFLTDGGVSTGALCNGSGNVNCFTNAGGAYVLSDSSVAGMEIAWLAKQACYLTRKCYSPAGTYKLNHPLLIPITADNQNNAMTGLMITGDGEKLTVDQASSDFGVGSFLESCGDPTGTFSSPRGRYNGASYCSGDLQNFSIRSSASSWSFAVGTTPIQMDGLAWGARLRIKDITIAGFNHNLNVIGDHTHNLRFHSFGGSYGIRYDHPSSILYGDLVWEDTRIENASIAAIDYDGAATDFSEYLGETYISTTPYGFLAENNACAVIMLGVHFQHLFTESVGNAVISDDHNYSSGTGTYTDSNKCRQIQHVQIDYWANLWDSSYFLGGGRARRAAFDIQGGSWKISEISNTGVGIVPPSAPSGPVPLAVFNVNSGAMSTTLIRSTELNSILSSLGTLPFFTNVTGGYDPGNVFLDGISFKGEMAKWNSAGSYSTTTAGDLFEFNSLEAGPAGVNAIAPVVGVALQSGITTANPVPLGTSGVLPVNTFWVEFSGAAPYKKSSGIRNVSLTPGSGYTNGTYTATGSGGGCASEPTLSVTVVNGSLTTGVITSVGGGCTSSPSFSIPSGAGAGTGGAISGSWPSGLATIAQSLTDPAIIGSAVAANGSISNGSRVIVVKLQGLQ